MPVGQVGLRQDMREQAAFTNAARPFDALHRKRPMSAEFARKGRLQPCNRVLPPTKCSSADILYCLMGLVLRNGFDVSTGL